MGAGVIDCSRLRQFRTASCPRQTCYKKLERRGEERRWRRTRTRATHVYVREDVASWRGCLSRSIDAHRDRPRTLHTRLFIFISLSIGVDERNETRKGGDLSFLLFEKLIIYEYFSLYEIYIVISLLSKTRNSSSLGRIEETIWRGDTSTGPQHLENGRGIFRSVSGNVCKVTSGNSRAGATRSEPLRGSVRDVVEEEEGGMLEQELSRAVARDTARNPV